MHARVKENGTVSTDNTCVKNLKNFYGNILTFIFKSKYFKLKLKLAQ